MDARDSRIAGLRYAAADAQAFYDWLVSQQGGGYAPSRVKLLLDSEATAQNIRNAQSPTVFGEFHPALCIGP